MAYIKGTRFLVDHPYFFDNIIEIVAHSEYSGEFMVDDNNPVWQVDSKLLTQVMELPEAGKYTVNVDEYKPYLISHNIYQSHRYYLLIMAYNGIREIKELKSGTDLVYFDLAQLENLVLTNQ